MKTLVEHIEYLINRYDCVIVPGLGALIARYEPAHIENGIIYAPTRKLAFNSSLIHNDGMVAASISRRDRISYESAMSIIDAEVATMRHQLNAEGEVSLGKTGVLSINSEDSDAAVIFTPFSEVGLTSEYALLPNVKVCPVMELASQESCCDDKEIVYKDRDSYSHLRNVLKIAASVALMIVMCVTLMTPITAPKGMDVNMASTSIIPSQKHSGFVLDKDKEGKAIVFVPVNDASSVELVDTAMHAKYRSEARPYSDSGRYCVVIASLPSKSTAESYIKAHKNSDDMGIISAGRHYRVYAASAHTKVEALEIASSEAFKSEYPDAWVCIR